MRDERLLERIHNLEIDPERREGNNPNRQIQSVLNYLQRILNTRQGSTPIAEDFGMPDFTNLPGAFSTGSTREVEQLLKEVIQKYEPRLSRVRIFFESQQEDLLSLRFKVEAQLAREEGPPVTFETVVDAGGKISIRE